MKKIALLLMLLPMLASADVVEIDGICYDLSAYNKTAEVTRNPNNYSGKVDIPATVVYNEVTYVVTSIGKEAFLDCRNLFSVTIPNSVIAILDHAFTGCRFLTAVTIPNSVEYINWGAFSECTSLTSIRLSNSITTIASNAFEKCRGLTSIIIPNSVTSIGAWSFKDCNSLTSIVIPNSVTHIGGGAFSNCSSLTTITIGSSVEIIDYNAFADCPKLTDVYCYVESVPVLAERVFYGTPIELSTLHVPATSIEAYRKVSPWDQFGEIVPLGKETAYRPFIEEGKVWVIRGEDSQPYLFPKDPIWIDYCYLDGDTIIGGQTCKQMKCFKNGNPSPLYIGAWYEQDKKVYFAGNNIERDDMGMYFAGDRPQFELLYDFTLSSGDNINLGDDMYVVQKRSEGITGFKGTYYELKLNRGNLIERWLEGVGSESWPYINHPYNNIGAGGTLLACIVDDEVIYLNDEYEFGTIVLGARKDRIDFTHTIKIKPKSRTAREAEAKSLYGEYNSQQLGINLNALDEAYQVSITDEAGKTVYEKTVNAGSIVGLNIDISAYAKGRYTVTVENSNESFTGQFETLATGISLTPALSRREGAIYNLQGQRINSLRKGLNIVDGRKVYVK
jgi:hypothetical protein